MDGDAPWDGHGVVEVGRQAGCECAGGETTGHHRIGVARGVSGRRIDVLRSIHNPISILIRCRKEAKTESKKREE